MIIVEIGFRRLGFYIVELEKYMQVQVYNPTIEY